MRNIPTTGELPNTPERMELWERQTVLEFFGGEKPIHVGTLYRGVALGRYPKPVYVSAHSVRWVADECRAALSRMLAARDDPKPPTRAGRPKRPRITEQPATPATTR